MSTLDNLVDALFKPSRQLGPYSSAFALPTGISPLEPFTSQVTIEEIATDKLNITTHPVEQGAAITDHSFKEPAELVLRLGWSNSEYSAVATDVMAISTIFSGQGEGGFNYVQEVYDSLLALQLNRIPFQIITGKRIYPTMLIKSMTSPTNNESEHSLFVTMICQEIIITQTTATSFPDASVQANPQSNGAVQNLGSKQPAITAFQLNADGSLGQQIGIHQ